ncbi:hypothetical protein [Nonomuraea sp. NPDC050310]|uniref:hypothetical protein n=1 Tax=Nonomuraea sp. NPDC050310 TaxID=3154935 RepID=UPI0033CC067C
MSTLRLAVDVIVRGHVLRADSTSSPDEVDGILGATSAENRARRRMWRDYGLIEFFWERHIGAPTWWGVHFTVQFHRLRSAGVGIAADPIRIEYGPLQPALPLESLRAALAELGVGLVERPRAQADVREFLQPGSGAQIVVVEGEVHAVSVPRPA